jgi:hypothetical protein
MLSGIGVHLALVCILDLQRSTIRRQIFTFNMSTLGSFVVFSPSFKSAAIHLGALYCFSLLPLLHRWPGENKSIDEARPIMGGQHIDGATTGHEV